MFASKSLKLWAIKRHALRLHDSKDLQIRHRRLSLGKSKLHRFYVKSSRAAGVGINSDFKLSQIIGIAEYLERRHFSSLLAKTNSNGLSCHFNSGIARQSSVFELAERDQVLLSIFYNKSILEIVVSSALETFSSGVSIRYFHLTLDLSIHIVMSMITVNGTRHCYGFGSSLNINQAIEKAKNEAMLIFDSYQTPGPTACELRRHANLYHMIPFTKPGLIRCELPTFNVNQYKLIQTPIEKFPPFTRNAFWNSLRLKRVKIDFDIVKESIFPFLNIYYCRASSKQLQNLFFSPKQIYLNEFRIRQLDFPKIPVNKVIHPVS